MERRASSVEAGAWTEPEKLRKPATAAKLEGMRVARGRGLAIVAAVLSCACGALALLEACGHGNDPYFQSVLLPSDTADTMGPYRIEAYVVAPHGIKEVGLRLANADATTFSQLPATAGAESGEAELWWLELPGRPAGTTYSFYLFAVDTKGNKVVYPEGAPDELSSFTIRLP